MPLDLVFLGFVIGKRFTRLAFCRLGGAFRGESLAGFTDFSTVMCSHCIHLLRLAFRRARVVAVAIRGLDASVHTVDDEFSTLILTDLSSCGYCFFLGLKMTAGTLGAVTLHIPTSIGIVNDMMRRTCHIDYPLCAFGQQTTQPSASE